MTLLGSPEALPALLEALRGPQFLVEANNLNSMAKFWPEMMKFMTIFTPDFFRMGMDGLEWDYIPEIHYKSLYIMHYLRVI